MLSSKWIILTNCRITVIIPMRLLMPVVSSSHSNDTLAKFPQLKQGIVRRN
jgi:hypothetical protein